jgi:hypothetical protein
MQDRVPKRLARQAFYEIADSGVGTFLRNTVLHRAQKGKISMLTTSVLFGGHLTVSFLPHLWTWSMLA